MQIVEQGHPFASFQDIQQLVDLLVTGGAKVYGADQALTEAVLTEIRTKEEPLEILYNNFIFEWRISPLQDGGLVAFLIDRTQRKKLENDLAHNQKMRTIGHLTGGIAHDFNNFLAVIIGNLDLIDLTVLPEKQAKRIQRALKAAENSATLTQRLLAYARKQPLHPTSLDINQLLLDFSDFMKHSLPPAIKVRLDLTENLPFAYIDKNQLETALVNLLVNAKDALNGEGNIVIRTCQKLVQRTYWQEQMLQLSVIDEGCGMDETTKKQIFEPFFTTKQNGKGSGLGLSMVYGFIRQSKGRVIVESSPGKGTTIHLQLPIAQENSQKITALLAPQEKKMNFANLLLVEDQQALRETLTEQLSEMGYRTVTVASAEAAMDYLNQKQPIDYLLSDVVLSGQLTGVDLANYVKQSYPQTKILLMTANFAEDIEKSTEFSVLSKPFHVDKLALLLSKL
ncbi:ATP-binding protein [[Pasteurella] aerogenes]